MPSEEGLIIYQFFLITLLLFEIRDGYGYLLRFFSG
jgi:hypothetical protein